MSIRSRRKAKVFVLGLSLICASAVAVLQFEATARETQTASPAAAMLQSLDAPTGLCAHVGLNDPALTTALSGSGRYLVHGVSADAEAVARARDAAAAANLRGVVSAEQHAVDRLPYADNLVNLVVVDDFAGQAKQGLSLPEVLRVLAPQGTAFLQTTGDAASARKELGPRLKQAGVESFEIVASAQAAAGAAVSGGVWVKFVKPRPDGLDVWSHRRYDASGTAVSSDETASIPTGVRWMAGPTWATGLRYSTVQCVTASERQLVYFFDDQIETPEGPKQQFSVAARDAFNGLLLWKHPAGKADKSMLVTWGDRVYTILDDGQPLAALNSATGEIVQRYEAAGRPSEILLHEGSLIVRRSSDEVRCLDPETGKLRWKNENAGSNLVADGGKVFFQTSGRRKDGQREDLVGCLDLKTGKELWRAGTLDWTPSIRNLVFAKDGVIVIGASKGTHAVSAEDGSHLWSYDYPLIGHGGSYSKVLYQHGLVWVHPAESDGKKQYAWEGLDPRTGEIKRRLPQPKNFSLKHRCCEDRATVQHILCGTIDYVDFETGAYDHVDAARHSCRDGGVLPANGMNYTFPHSCHCYPMLRGFIGLVTVPDEARTPDAKPEDRLIAGPALGVQPKAASRSSRKHLTEWTTLRGDARRSGSTTAPGPDRLQQLWERQIVTTAGGQPAVEWQYNPNGGSVSSPVASGGLVFVAAGDEHRLQALDAETGKLRWSFTTGGRIDSPPTIDRGLCLLGSRDGWVYCLQADEGELVWKFRAAPTPERILAFGQLESLWPVVGGVMVHDGLAYFAAGRHSHADGGVHVYAVEPETGKFVWHAQPQGFQGVADLLVGQGDFVSMITADFDARTGENHDRTSAETLRAGRLGLLSNEWYQRAWAMRKNQQRWSVAGETGQLLSFNDDLVAGFQAGGDQSREFNRGLAPLDGEAKIVLKPISRRSDDRLRTGSELWSHELPQGSQVQSLILAGGRLFVAGRLNGTDRDSFTVRSYAVADGKLLAEHPLPAPVVYECLAVAGNRLFVSLEDGRVLCLGEK